MPGLTLEVWQVRVPIGKMLEESEGSVVSGFGASGKL